MGSGFELIGDGGPRLDATTDDQQASELALGEWEGCSDSRAAAETVRLVICGRVDDGLETGGGSIRNGVHASRSWSCFPTVGTPSVML